jgi:uncharacterized protein
MESEPLQNRGRDWAAVMFALVLPTVVTLAYFVFAAKFSPGVQQFTYGTAKTFQFLFPLAYVVVIQRKKIRLWPWSMSGIGTGLAFGLAVGASMLGLYHFGLKSAEFFNVAADAMRAKIAGMDLGSPAVFIAVGVFYSLIHSVLEEYYWRWFVFGELRELTRLGTAILISSLGFMVHHVLVIGTYFGFFTPVTWLFSFGVAIGGAVWAWLYHRTGSLVGPWLSHLLVDATIFLVGYEIALPLVN